MRRPSRLWERLVEDWRYAAAADARDDEVVDPPLPPFRPSRVAAFIGSLGAVVFFGSSLVWDDPAHSAPWLWLPSVLLLCLGHAVHLALEGRRLRGQQRVWRWTLAWALLVGLAIVLAPRHF